MGRGSYKPVQKEAVILSRTEQEEINVQVALDMYNNVLVPLDFTQAHQYLNDNYRQHDPLAEDGPDGLRKFLETVSETKGKSGAVILVKNHNCSGDKNETDDLVLRRCRRTSDPNLHLSLREKGICHPLLSTGNGLKIRQPPHLFSPDVASMAHSTTARSRTAVQTATIAAGRKTKMMT